MEGTQVFREFIGDAEFIVRRRGSWFDIVANGNVIQTVCGKEPTKTALKDWMHRAYQRDEKIQAPRSVRSDVGKLIARIIEKDFQAEFKLRLPTISESPALAEHYGEAAKAACVNRAIMAGVLYTMRAQKMRGPMPDIQKQYFEAIQPAKYRLPASWQSYFRNVQKYAQSIAKNATKEGGVNQAWSQ